MEMMQVMTRPKKRLFLALLLASLVVAALSTYGLWKVSAPGLSSISQHLPLLLGAMLLLVVAVGALSVIGVILALMGLPTFGIFKGVAWTVINMLFPVATFLGRLLDVNKERVERSFIEVSNQLIRQKHVKVKPEQLLILTPHCIQLDTCPHKITRDIANCKKCGGCQVGDLLLLSEKYGVHVAIVTGGTLARKVIKTLRPRAVLAIACERDLTSGIQDVFPLPVIGVLNERPYGPCCNTKVQMSAVEQAVLQFIDTNGRKA